MVSGIEEGRERVRKELLPFQDQIAKEHCSLVLKEFQEGLSASEKQRKAELEDQLDRIEDALNGEWLDQLEQFARSRKGLGQALISCAGALLSRKEER